MQKDTPRDYPEMVELELLGNIVADYDETYYPVGKPTLIDVIKLRMYEMGLTQAALANFCHWRLRGQLLSGQEGQAEEGRRQRRRSRRTTLQMHRATMRPTRMYWMVILMA